MTVVLGEGLVILEGLEECWILRERFTRNNGSLSIFERASRSSLLDMNIMINNHPFDESTCIVV